MNELKSLKELLTQRINYFEKWVNEKFASMSTALELQAKEYERRLENLNHEAEQLKHMQATYMTRELYQAEHEKVEQDIKDLNAFKNNLIGKLVIIPAMVSLAISVAVLLLNYFVFGGK